MIRFALCALLFFAGLAEAQGVFPVGSSVEVTANTALNVRSAPGAVCPPAPPALCPTQPRGAQAVVLGPPVTRADLTVWYQLDYVTGADGWSNAAFLKLVAPPTPLPTFTLVNGVACELRFSVTGFTVYQQTTPTGPAIKLGAMAGSASGPFTFPCPTVPGTYYFSLTETLDNGPESPRGGTVGLIIKAPTP